MEQELLNLIKTEFDKVPTINGSTIEYILNKIDNSLKNKKVVSLNIVDFLEQILNVYIYNRPLGCERIFINWLFNKEFFILQLSDVKNLCNRLIPALKSKHQIYNHLFYKFLTIPKFSDFIMDFFILNSSTSPSINFIFNTALDMALREKTPLSELSITELLKTKNLPFYQNKYLLDIIYENNLFNAAELLFDKYFGEFDQESLSIFIKISKEHNLRTLYIKATLSNFKHYFTFKTFIDFYESLSDTELSQIKDKLFKQVSIFGYEKQLFIYLGIEYKKSFLKSLSFDDICLLKNKFPPTEFENIKNYLLDQLYTLKSKPSKTQKILSCLNAIGSFDPLLQKQEVLKLKDNSDLFSNPLTKAWYLRYLERNNLLTQEKVFIYEE